MRKIRNKCDPKIKNCLPFFEEKIIDPLLEKAFGKLAAAELHQA